MLLLARKNTGHRPRSMRPLGFCSAEELAMLGQVNRASETLLEQSKTLDIIPTEWRYGLLLYSTKTVELANHPLASLLLIKETNSLLTKIDAILRDDEGLSQKYTRICTDHEEQSLNTTRREMITRLDLCEKWTEPVGEKRLASLRAIAVYTPPAFVPIAQPLVDEVVLLQQTKKCSKAIEKRMEKIRELRHGRDELFLQRRQVQEQRKEHHRLMKKKRVLRMVRRWLHLVSKAVKYARENADNGVIDREILYHTAATEMVHAVVKEALDRILLQKEYLKDVDLSTDLPFSSALNSNSRECLFIGMLLLPCEKNEQGVYNLYKNMIGKHAHALHMRVEFTLFAVERGEFPTRAQLTHLDGLLLCGGSSSENIQSNESYINLIAVLQHYKSHEVNGLTVFIAALGAGHRVMAHALGGVVHSKERTSEYLDGTHYIHDHVLESLPESYDVVYKKGRSGKFIHQFSKHNVLSIAGHPEIPLFNTTVMGETMMKDVGMSMIKMRKSNAAARKICRTLFSFFKQASENGKFHRKNRKSLVCPQQIIMDTLRRLEPLDQFASDIMQNENINGLSIEIGFDGDNVPMVLSLDKGSIRALTFTNLMKSLVRFSQSSHLMIRNTVPDLWLSFYEMHDRLMDTELLDTSLAGLEASIQKADWTGEIHICSNNELLLKTWKIKKPLWYFYCKVHSICDVMEEGRFLHSLENYATFVDGIILPQNTLLQCQQHAKYVNCVPYMHAFGLQVYVHSEHHASTRTRVSPASVLMDFSLCFSMGVDGVFLLPNDSLHVLSLSRDHVQKRRGSAISARLTLKKMKFQPEAVYIQKQVRNHYLNRNGISEKKNSILEEQEADIRSNIPDQKVKFISHVTMNNIDEFSVHASPRQILNKRRKQSTQLRKGSVALKERLEKTNSLRIPHPPQLQRTLLQENRRTKCSLKGSSRYSRALYVSREEKKIRMSDFHDRSMIMFLSLDITRKPTTR